MFVHIKISVEGPLVQRHPKKERTDQAESQAAAKRIAGGLHFPAGGAGVVQKAHFASA
jgi:hypothetical protein